MNPAKIFKVKPLGKSILHDKFDDEHQSPFHLWALGLLSKRQIYSDHGPCTDPLNKKDICRLRELGPSYVRSHNLGKVILRESVLLKLEPPKFKSRVNIGIKRNRYTKGFAVHNGQVYLTI